MRVKPQKFRRAVAHGLAIGLWAFLLAGLSAYFAQTAVDQLRFAAAGFVLLLLVILLGIVFDIVGVAAAAAQEGPLNARATNRVFGAPQAVWLVHNAHRVASVCNDVVGDVSGTLSGAIGITLVFKLLHAPADAVSAWAKALMTGGIAALVVGGKGVAKTYAIENGTQIIFRVGVLIAWVERLLRLRLLRDRRRPRKRPGHAKG